MSRIRSFISFVVFLCTMAVNAQDVIVFRNGDEVEAKVEEISSTQIKYKRTSNLDGPSYVSEKSEVSVIKYNNGEQEVFDAVPVSSNLYPKPMPAVFNDVKVTRKSPSGLAYRDNNMYLSNSEANNYLGSDYFAFSEQSHRMKSGFGLMMMGAGLYVAMPTFLILSFATSENAGDSSNHYSYDYYDADRYVNTPFLVASVVSGVAACVALPIGVVKFATGKTRCHRILKNHYSTVYEENPKEGSYDNLTFKVNAKPNGLSMSLSF